MNVKSVRIDVSPAELIDKITILTIKSERITDPEKLENVHAELALLAAARDAEIPASKKLATLTAGLKAANESLWRIEDDIRDRERAQDFGPRFVELARLIYRTNDDRAKLKRQIGELLGSDIVEEKSYQSY